MTFDSLPNITESNTGITRKVLKTDFTPLDVVEYVDGGGHLRILRTIVPWNNSNRLIFFWGYTPNGQHTLVLHGGCNIGADGKTWNSMRVSIDFGPWHQLGWSPKSISYKPNGMPSIGIPDTFDVIHSDLTGENVYVQGYDEVTRIWMVKIYKNATLVIDVIGEGDSVPFWMGSPSGPYLLHGICTNREGFDYWGGYVDYTKDTTRIVVVHPETLESLTFYGKMLVDREYHAKFCDRSAGCCVDNVSFSAISINTPQMDSAFLTSINPITGTRDLPSEWGLPSTVKHQKQARINVVGGESFRFDDFNLSYSSERPADNFRIWGTSEKGEVELTAEILKSFSWEPFGNPTYWNPKLYPTWGRHFFKWSGHIGSYTLPDGTIGFGEFSRVYERWGIQEWWDSLPLWQKGFIVLGVPSVVIGSAFLIADAAKKGKK